MTLEEYTILKKEAAKKKEHNILFDRDIIVISPNGDEETIALGALEQFIQQGYTTKDANF
tara:strand:+ start:138 stop:317 length:180 start_codon:yes stop_codon:yes gene_type:complete